MIKLLVLLTMLLAFSSSFAQSGGGVTSGGSTIGTGFKEPVQLKDESGIFNAGEVISRDSDRLQILKDVNSYLQRHTVVPLTRWENNRAEIKTNDIFIRADFPKGSPTQVFLDVLELNNGEMTSILSDKYTLQKETPVLWKAIKPLSPANNYSTDYIDDWYEKHAYPYNFIPE